LVDGTATSGHDNSYAKPLEPRSCKHRQSICNGVRGSYERTQAASNFSPSPWAKGHSISITATATNQYGAPQIKSIRAGKIADLRPIQACFPDSLNSDNSAYLDEELSILRFHVPVSCSIASSGHSICRKLRLHPRKIDTQESAKFACPKASAVRWLASAIPVYLRESGSARHDLRARHYWCTPRMNYSQTRRLRECYVAL
jgi:hypothetical protein